MIHINFCDCFFAKLLTIRQLTRFCSVHLQTLLCRVDPVVVQEKQQTSFHFLFAAAIVLFTQLYGLFGLHHQATGNWPASLRDLASSPYVYTHQVSPQAMWSQIDLSFAGIDFSVTFTVFLAFAFTRQVDQRQQFCLRRDVDQQQRQVLLLVNGKTLKEEETKQLLAIRRRVKTAFALLVALIFLSFMFFSYVNLYLNGACERKSLLDLVLYWAVLYPLYVAYIFYGV